MSDWLKDPAEIYRRSFATIRAEARLELMPEPIRPIATRMIHACGMVDLLDDLRSQGDVAGAVASALGSSRPILVDAKMVAAGFLADRLPSDIRIICGLEDPTLAKAATALATTRSAALVTRWRPHLEGAVVVIGNAPTALFQLLQELADGAPRPAAIIATPVGFVGAVESKQALVEAGLDLPYVTVLGRRGGSAMAAAALNACLVGAS